MTPSCREDELLICCARVDAVEAVQRRIQELLDEPIQWQELLNRSWWHRLRPLTYRHLSAQPRGRVPACVLKVLGEQAHELSERNERLWAAQLEIASLFEQAAIPMLVFKGPTLAADAYGDLSLRECGDLDMLIRQADFPQVKETLADSGFNCLWDESDSERKRQLFACEFRRGNLELDIHWDLAPHWHNYHVDFDDLWECGVPIAPAGNMARKFSPEDAIEILCMHGTRHWWDRLRWICDIAELVNRGLISDWDLVEARAAKSHCYRSVSLGLRLAGDLLGARIPPDIQAKLDRLPVVKRLASQVGTWLGSAEQAEEVRSLPDRFLFRMRLCERWRDRVPQLMRYLSPFPSRNTK